MMIDIQIIYPKTFLSYKFYTLLKKNKNVKAINIKILDNILTYLNLFLIKSQNFPDTPGVRFKDFL